MTQRTDALSDAACASTANGNVLAEGYVVGRLDLVTSLEGSSVKSTSAVR